MLHPIPFARGRLSPLASLATISALRRIHRAIAPAVTHHVSLQPSVLGLIAALGLSAPSVNALTGLGYTFTSSTAKANGCEIGNRRGFAPAARSRRSDKSRPERATTARR